MNYNRSKESTCEKEEGKAMYSTVMECKTR